MILKKGIKCTNIFQFINTGLVSGVQILIFINFNVFT